MGRILIVAGLFLVLLGLLWPLMVKSGLGRLPGDFNYQGQNFKVYLPLATCLLLSILISLLIRFFQK